MELTADFITKTKNLKTPFVVFDLLEIRRNYLEIVKSFPHIGVFYAVKCNPHPRIIQFLKKLGSGFEVASIGETRQLLSQGVSPEKIICMHTIKSPEFLQYLAKNGIDVLAADSYEEIDKIAQFAPKSKIAVRVVVENEGSGWPLLEKFGLEVTEFPKILNYIQNKGLVPYGLTFHVGSQCENDANWIKALDICSSVWQEARKAGIKLEYLSLGGGLAAKYTNEVPKTNEVGKGIVRKLKSDFAYDTGEIKFTIEPGRAVVASAGILVNTVFGLAKRGNKNWAYIETGTYNGLVEAIETTSRKFYPLAVEAQDRKKISYYIGGPSCVSLDTPFEQVELPEIFLGERLYILTYGAYNITCASPFNGFPIPEAYFYEDLREGHLT